tara:strand:+ start:3293 stop:3436 length:144 start_codon:yes stop_codon:yes gene_type:complete
MPVFKTGAFNRSATPPQREAACYYNFVISQLLIVGWKTTATPVTDIH